MDSRITKKRLNDHISYDWMKYIGLLMAVIMFFSLVFTMTERKAKTSEKMEIFYVSTDYSIFSQTGSDTISEKLRNKRFFGQDILEVSGNPYDVTDNNFAQVLTTRIAAGEGDMLAASYPFFTVRYVDGNMMYPLGEVLEEAKSMRLYDLDLESDRSLYQAEFKKIKDEVELKEAMNQENERRKHYRLEAEKLLASLEKYPELKMMYGRNAATKALQDQDKPETEPAPTGGCGGGSSAPEDKDIVVEAEKLWALNLTPMMQKLSASTPDGLIFTSTAVSEERKKQALENREDEYYMGLITFKEKNLSQFYETLVVMNYFIETYR